jgi:hypothetical protein
MDEGAGVHPSSPPPPWPQHNKGAQSGRQIQYPCAGSMCGMHVDLCAGFMCGQVAKALHRGVVVAPRWSPPPRRVGGDRFSADKIGAECHAQKRLAAPAILVKRPERLEAFWRAREATPIATLAAYTWTKRTDNAAARATATATPTNDRPPTTDASQATSRNSSLMVFHIFPLPTLNFYALTKLDYIAPPNVLPTRLWRLG